MCLKYFKMWTLGYLHAKLDIDILFLYIEMHIS